MQTILNLFSPNIVHAATITTTSTLVVFAGKLTKVIVNPLIIFLFAVTFMVFIYGVISFWISSISGGEKGASKEHMLWGIIGMFLMMSMFGIMRLIEFTFGLGHNVFFG